MTCSWATVGVVGSCRLLGGLYRYVRIGEIVVGSHSFCGRLCLLLYGTGRSFDLDIAANALMAVNQLGL